MLNAHIGAIYFCKNTKKIKKNDFVDGFCLQGELDLTLFVSKGDNEDVFSVILGSKYIVSLHLTLYLILNLNFNLTFCNLLFFFDN